MAGGGTGGGGGGGGINKMMVMLPVMFLARKLDGEDPRVVLLLRAAYAAVQGLCLLAVLWTYRAAARVRSDRTIYVPPPALPFGVDAEARKKYTQVSFAAHVQSQARSLLGSTLFGIAMTVGLHLYKGMVVSLAIQSVMGPIGLWDNALVRAVLFGGGGLTPEARLFHEKLLEELTDQDDVVDQQGQPVAVRRPAVTAGAAAAAAKPAKERSLEELLLDTWDAGVKADIAPLLKALTKGNCNYQTKEDAWSPLMILAGLGVAGAPAAIQKLRGLGADVGATDKEGWTALHWAAFHGQVSTARELASETRLLAAKDKEGNTPIDMARKEGNEEVAKIYEAALGETKKSK